MLAPSFSFTTLLILGFSALSSRAQDAPDGQNVLAGLPECSLACFPASVKKSTCELTDYTCQCTGENAKIIQSSITECLKGTSCKEDDYKKITKFGQTFCPSVLAKDGSAPQTASGSGSASATATAKGGMTTEMSSSMSGLEASSIALGSSAPTSTNAAAPGAGKGAGVGGGSLGVGVGVVGFVLGLGIGV